MKYWYSFITAYITVMIFVVYFIKIKVLIIDTKDLLILGLFVLLFTIVFDKDFKKRLKSSL